MPLHLHNTLTHRKERFEPLDPGHVRMYVCGPTVYDYAHIGNARPVVVFDVLYRVLKARYAKVTYVRNITDIDDKIMAAAKESSERIDSITSRTTRAYHEDMRALGALDPDIEPRATQHVPQMIAMIETLIADGHAYAAEGHVLFNVPTMRDYGKLSGRSRDEQIAGARVDVAPYKKDPADFVLWKPSAPDQPGWDSPWGRGRPGWHIECSAMSEAHLGATFDIHGGGHDLIFPHHENEIAQSECAHGGRPFVRYWVHNGYLVVNGEKMSKSLGNFFTVRELLAKAPGEAIRLLLLKTHYRAPLDFTDDGLRQAKGELDRFYTALRGATDVAPDGGETPAGVMDALEDDLNTPLAIAYLHEMARDLNAEKDEKRRAQFKANLINGGALLGLLRSNPNDWFQKIVSIHESVPAKHAPAMNAQPILAKETIEKLIDARNAARKAKNFKEADRIRDELKAGGVLLEDGPKGTTWKRAG
ncbi:MAG TPA: cysteine--tRNA ligase [Alphaproteobacteria bacterium]|nr:cysteine--tRNA ligase [Alphaproteobacteria bacterium]